MASVPLMSVGRDVRRYHLWLTAVLLVSALLRFAALPSFPPGIEHDEVAEAIIADGILAGNHAIFFREAYGQEPLFLYLVAGIFAVAGRSVLALRFVSASVGLLTVAASARWARRLFGSTVALLTAAGLGVMLWPVFWSRVGLRGMLLPLTMLLGADRLWAALRERFPYRSAVLGGFWFGVAAYTYLAARGIPFVLLGFVGLLFFLDRDRFRRRWRVLLLSGLLAVLIAAPLVVHLVRNKGDQSRVYEVDAPLRALRTGDWGPVLANVPRVLGMFSVQGDATERNNLTLRPVFVEPIWCGLFYLGFVIALVRSRDVRYSLLLVWLGAMLLPSIVTTEAPNFVRTLGALPITMILPGIGAEFALSRLRRGRAACAIVGVVVLGAAALANAGLTARDYFTRWSKIPEVGFVWQEDMVAVAGWLDAHPEVSSVTVGGLSNTTMDAPSLDLLMKRKNVAVRWCDPGSPLGAGGGLVLPAEGGQVLIPAVVPLSDSLASYLVDVAGAASHDHGSFRQFQVAGQALSAHAPEEFEGGVRLLDVMLPDGAVRPGDMVKIVTVWQSDGTAHSDLKAFVHLVDSDGLLRAQHDGLDCPARFWRSQDRIVQFHQIRLPGDIGAGRLTAHIGVYDRQTLVPFPLLDGRPYVVAGEIEIRVD